MSPKILKTITEMRSIFKEAKNSIGFVPTMGFLHSGHLSLVKKAKHDNDIVVVSIYVNPTQFSPNEDLNSYPRDLDKDIALLSELDVDYIFFPSNEMMYPKGYKTWVNVDDITEILCGNSRATHFKGVTTIVCKLINIVNPTRMYMGEKDFQQLVVLRKMVTDLNMQVEIIGCPLVREDSGLAMSSRNKYLSLKGKENAICLYQSLQKAQELFNNGETDFTKVKEILANNIVAKNGIVDYIELVDSTNLEYRKKIRSGDRLLMAVRIENTRLIDNIEIC